MHKLTFFGGSIKNTWMWRKEKKESANSNSNKGIHSRNAYLD